MAGGRSAALFALIASLRGEVRRREIGSMADALLGGEGEPRVWCDGPAEQDGCEIAVAVRVSGVLPEDRFDAQPIVDGEGRSVFVCQARLDNREELVEKLDLSGCEMADSAVLEAAYRRWGAACLDHLTGDYAFAAYSVRERRMFAAVDHVGHYRLFYAAEQGRLVLSAQLAAVRACPGVSLRADEDALGLLTIARIREGETGFAAIRSLPGGHALRWVSGSVETSRWWKPETQVRRPAAGVSESIEMVGEVFQRAVRSCLRSAGPVSTTLSGGLDSGLVTATAAKVLEGRGQEMAAYTTAPASEDGAIRRTGWDVDDAPFAAATAAMYPNLRHVILRTEQRTALDLLPELLRRSATPVRNGANHVWLDAILRRAHTSGSRVMLAGGRGNFGLSYHGLGGFGELFRNLQWRAALHLARSMQDAGERQAWKTIGGGLLPQGIFDWMRWTIYGGRTREAGERDFLSAMFRASHRDHLVVRRPPERTRASFARRAVVPTLVWAADPMAQWDVEMRDPTGDRRLLETLLTMPLHVFTAGGRARGLARQLGAGMLPEKVRLRRTQGQQAPDYAAVMGRQAGRYRGVVDAMSRSESCVGLFDLHGVRKGLAQLEVGATAAYLTSGIDRVVGVGMFLLGPGEAKW